MFENLKPIPADPIIKTIAMFRDDPRENKIDLGVGVFRNADGVTPVMAAVREAEKEIYDQQVTKSYVGLTGDEVYNEAIADLIFDDSPARPRVRAVQTPGGCGALGVLTAMLHRVAPGHRVWLSDPTWGNHYPLLQQGGFETRTYPYFDPEHKTVRGEAQLDALSALGVGDIVLLHGCCHNPSGADLTPAIWDEIAAICAKNGIFPFVDLAYQGFGESLEADAYGVRALASQVESMVVASSCSKNFGLYRERVGCALMVGETERVADITRDHFLAAARASYSMPPDHGGAVVARILTDPRLRSSWESELEGMRERMLQLRTRLAAVLRDKSGSEDWNFIADHRGMFSTLMLDERQTNSLLNDHAIYTVVGGRINIAGFANENQIDRFASALMEVSLPVS